MKTALFIDGSNISAAAKSVGYEVDYKKLLPAFDKDNSLLRAFYYTAVLPDEEGHVRMRPLIDFLEYNGYSLVTKQCKTFKDPLTGLTKVKGNMDIEIAVDAMELADKLDFMVLFSGDGDFTRLVKAVQSKAVHVTVVSAMDTVADELRRQADLFIDMKQLRSIIGRDRHV